MRRPNINHRSESPDARTFSSASGLPELPDLISEKTFNFSEMIFVDRTLSGLDDAILDPMDHKIMTVLKITRMLLGQDPYCRNFPKTVRAETILS